VNVRILSLSAATLGLALALTGCSSAADPAPSEPAPISSESAPSPTTGEDIANSGAAVLPLRVVEIESREVDGVQVNRLVLTDATPLSGGEFQAVLSVLPSTSADKIALVATTADGAPVDVTSAAVELDVPQDTYPEGALFTADDIDALR
jgi:hypothetical protein